MRGTHSVPDVQAPGGQMASAMGRTRPVSRTVGRILQGTAAAGSECMAVPFPFAAMVPAFD